MKNIERFNLYTAHIFGTLYEAFPVATRLKPNEVVQAMSAVVPVNGDTDLRELNGFVGHTIQWLRETEYLLARGDSGYVLAPKAFEALGSRLPEALRQEPGDSSASIGDKLIDVSADFGKDLAKETRKEVATKLVGEVIGYAMRTWTGP